MFSLNLLNFFIKLEAMKILKVLMFISVSLFTSVVGYLYLCNIGILSSRNYYYFYVKDISKIDKEACVFLNGMNVGYVCDISFSDETLISKVTISLRNKLRLNENSEIIISGIDSLYKKLDINLNDGDMLRSNSEVKVVDKSLKTRDVLSKLENILNNLSTISDSLSNISKNVNNDIQKLSDNNFTGNLIETSNKVRDIMNRIKLPWFLRKK